MRLGWPKKVFDEKEKTTWAWMKEVVERTWQIRYGNRDPTLRERYKQGWQPKQQTEHNDDEEAAAAATDQEEPLEELPIDDDWDESEANDELDLDDCASDSSD